MRFAIAAEIWYLAFKQNFIWAFIHDIQSNKTNTILLLYVYISISIMYKVSNVLSYIVYNQFDMYENVEH